MQSRWSDQEARVFVERYAEAGEDLALRVYTSRLIGQDEDLVLHGGGNTSVKTTVRDITGDDLDVVCVKGSGWNLATIEPAGIPALQLEPLRRLLALDGMTDEVMVNQVRRQLLDVSAPNPSVEALLHASLPHKFVDHTHADAILILSNQPNGEQLLREALGDDVVILPWVMPGFPLAKDVAAAHAANPDCRAIVLLNHGIFTFADDARASYEAMIEFVDRAERSLNEKAPRIAAGSPECPDDVAAIAAQATPIVRGAIAAETGSTSYARRVLEFRTADDLRALTARDDCASLMKQGPLTPDHSLRTKATYLWVDRETATDRDAFRAAVDIYVADYRAYFDAHKGDEAMLDPHPNVVVIEGVGVIGAGADKKAATIAADIAEHTVRGKAQGADLGEYVALPPAQLFEMEYWSLQLAKLGKQQPPRLAGQVAYVTGAAGAIGHGIAEELLAAGAHVFLVDIDQNGLDRVAGLLGERFSPSMVGTAAVDVTDAAAVDASFDACALQFGGVDCLVPNAGVAHVSTLRDMNPADFQRVVDINLGGTMTVLRAAAKTFEQQDTGGSIVLQASKNVFSPGASFGAYSASKAGAHQLGKIAALELAPLGVRVNMVNADAVFGKGVSSKLWDEVGPDRMKSRGLDEQGLRDYYKERSMLKCEVTPAHVGAAVVFFAEASTPTTGATLPVDAGVPGAFPR